MLLLSLHLPIFLFPTFYRAPPNDDSNNILANNVIKYPPYTKQYLEKVIVW